MAQPAAALQSFDDFIKKANLDPKSHQREGIQWILANELNPNPLENVRGGLIADEMGLGKTILMLGTMVSNFQRRTLIVLPLSLLDQWIHEIERTLGHHAMVYHGAHKKEITFEELEAAPIVVTTYGHVQLTKKMKRAHFYTKSNGTGSFSTKRITSAPCGLINFADQNNSRPISDGWSPEPRFKIENQTFTPSAQ